MKAIFLFLAIFAITSLSAQTKITYGLFKKSDGAKIKGASKIRGFEDQVEIYSYTGGSDNTATIEITIPTGTYVTEFRNLMNTAAAANQSAAINKTTVANKSVAAPATTIKQDINIKASPNLKQLQTQQPTLARAEISVTETKTPNYSYRIMSKIVLEDVKVESCTDDAASGKTKIKLKAARIGWVYYSYESVTGKQNGSSQSGWNTVTGTAWNNF